MYKGVHSAAALEKYAEKITNHTFAKLKTKEDVDAFAKAHPVSVIGESARCLYQRNLSV